MGKPGYTTPRMIKEYEEKKIEDTIKSAKKRISKSNELEENIYSFLSGYEKSLEVYYDKWEEVEELKETLISQVESNRITQVVADEKLEQANTELEKLRKKTVERIEGISDRFKELLREMETLEGVKIDDSDMKLLNSGIELSQSELDSLVDRHKKTNNVTMLRVLLEYGKKHELHVGYKTADERIRVVDRLLTGSKRGLKNPNGYKGIEDRTEKHRQTLFNKFVGWIL